MLSFPLKLLRNCYDELIFSQKTLDKRLERMCKIFQKILITVKYMFTNISKNHLISPNCYFRIDIDDTNKFETIKFPRHNNYNNQKIILLKICFINNFIIKRIF